MPRGIQLRAFSVAFSQSIFTGNVQITSHQNVFEYHSVKLQLHLQGANELTCYHHWLVQKKCIRNEVASLFFLTHHNVISTLSVHTLQNACMTGWLGLYSPRYTVCCFQSLTSTSCNPASSSSSSLASNIASRFCGTNSLKPCMKAFIWFSTRWTKRHLMILLQNTNQMLYAKRQNKCSSKI